MLGLREGERDRKDDTALNHPLPGTENSQTQISGGKSTLILPLILPHLRYLLYTYAKLYFLMYCKLHIYQFFWGCTKATGLLKPAKPSSLTLSLPSKRRPPKREPACGERSTFESFHSRCSLLSQKENLIHWPCTLFPDRSHLGQSVTGGGVCECVWKCGENRGTRHTHT